jgi:CRP-like cAMP-binding protein
VREKLRPDLQELELKVRHPVFSAGGPIEHVYFPQSCLISIHARMEDGGAVEIAAVGREGLVGLPIFLGGEHTPSTAFCQIPGWSSRITAQAFRAAVGASFAFKTVLLRYTQALLTQVSQSVACNRAHSIEERCARWLLLTHDSVFGDSFMLTQEFLAEMLGVHRPRVSIVAGILQQAGLIRYSRGRVRVVDRAGLENSACECYGIVTREYERLLESSGKES